VTNALNTLFPLIPNFCLPPPIQTTRNRVIEYNQQIGDARAAMVNLFRSWRRFVMALLLANWNSNRDGVHPSEYLFQVGSWASIWFPVEIRF
jgi:hypothetical protein